MPDRRRTSRIIAPALGARLDRQHPLSQGLVWYVVPGADPRELVAGGLGTAMGAARWDGVSIRGAAVTTAAANGNGWKWPWSEALATMTDKWTVLMWADPVTLGGAATLFAIPVVSGNGDPYGALYLQQSGTGTAHLFSTGQNGGNYNEVFSAANLIATTDPLVHFGATRNGTVVKFWRNGKQHGSNVATASGNIYLNNKVGPALMNRHSIAPTEGAGGTVLQVMLWNRELTADEIASLEADPFLMLLPPMSPPRLHVAESGGTGAIITTTADAAAAADTTGSVTFGGDIATTADPATGADRTGSVTTAAFVTTVVDPAVASDRTGAVNGSSTIASITSESATATGTSTTVSWNSTLESDVDVASAQDTTGAVTGSAPITTVADPASAPDTTGAVLGSSVVAASVDPAVADGYIATVGGGSSASISSNVDPAVADGTSANQVHYGATISASVDPAVASDTTGAINLGKTIIGLVDPALAQQRIGDVHFGNTIESDVDPASTADTTAIVSDVPITIISGSVIPAATWVLTGAALASSTISSTPDAAVAADVPASVFLVTTISASVEPAATVDTGGTMLTPIHLLGDVIPAFAIGHDAVVVGFGVVFGYDASRRSRSFGAGRGSSSYDARKVTVT